MKFFCLYTFLVLFLALRSQDKIYFLDGNSKTGKVFEIGIDEIKIQSSGIIESFYKSDVLLIEYKNGLIEKYNSPEKTIVYNRDDTENPKPFRSRTDDEFQRNQVSLNTLALVNSDVSVFFERISQDWKFGFGGMAAYNFNPYSSIINTHIFIVDNSKKNYDLGAFANIYLRGLSEKDKFYFGMMIKYTRLHFTSEMIDSVRVGNTYAVNLTYKNSSGGQLATLFTCGNQVNLTKNFFIKTLFGIGGFNLRGDYKKQYNYQANRSVNASSQTNRTLLLKIYLGFNAGFNF